MIDVKGLKSFVSDYPECKAVMLYSGKDKVMVDGILCFPCEDFLKSIAPGKTIVE